MSNELRMKAHVSTCKITVDNLIMITLKQKHHIYRHAFSSCCTMSNFHLKRKCATSVHLKQRKNSLQNHCSNNIHTTTTLNLGS